MARSGIKGYDILLTGKTKILSDDTEEKYKGIIGILRLLKRTAYNEMIFA